MTRLSIFGRRAMDAFRLCLGVDLFFATLAFCPFFFFFSMRSGQKLANLPRSAEATLGGHKNRFGFSQGGGPRFKRDTSTRVDRSVSHFFFFFFFFVRFFQFFCFFTTTRTYPPVELADHVCGTGTGLTLNHFYGVGGRKAGVGGRARSTEDGRSSNRTAAVAIALLVGQSYCRVTTFLPLSVLDLRLSLPGMAPKLGKRRRAGAGTAIFILFLFYFVLVFSVRLAAFGASPCPVPTPLLHRLALPHAASS